MTENNGGRGGPAADPNDQYSSIDYMETENFYRYLDETEKYYNVVFTSFESVLASIEEQSELWANTPTFIPIENPRVSDYYGRRVGPFSGKVEFHAGLDLPKRTGTKIFAPANGKVTFSGWKGGYGNFLQVSHGKGLASDKKRQVTYITRYGHLHKVLVKLGDQVKRGQVIATVGNTGRSTGPHLHYEVWINGKHMDPLRLIKSFSIQHPLRK